MEPEHWIAIAGILGTAFGVVVGVAATWRIEKSRWDREDSVWWKRDRRQAYAELVQAADDYARALDRAEVTKHDLIPAHEAVSNAEASESDPDLVEALKAEMDRKGRSARAANNSLSEAITGFFRAQSEVSLLGTQAVQDAAGRLAQVGHKGMNLMPEFPFDPPSFDQSEWDHFILELATARADFILAARSDLGVAT